MSGRPHPLYGARNMRREEKRRNYTNHGGVSFKLLAPWPTLKRALITRNQNAMYKGLDPVCTKVAVRGYSSERKAHTLHCYYNISSNSFRGKQAFWITRTFVFLH